MARLSKRRLKEIRSLTRRKYRERYEEMLVEGVRGVKAALDAGADVREVLVTEAFKAEGRLSGYESVLSGRVSVVAVDVLGEVSAVETSQGVVAVVGIERLSEDVLPSCRRLVVLDRMRDPGNAGTLIRSAAWFGIDAIVTGRGTVDLYNPKVVRSTMGGLWDVAHVEVAEPADILRSLRAHGFAVYGADLDGTAVDRWTPAVPSVLVLGSEAHGLTDGIRAEIDESIVIPGRSPRGGTESLNVAVAAGILMYEWTRAS